MTEKQAMVDSERLAEAAYAAMYDARPYSVKDLFDDACAHYRRAIEAARTGGFADDLGRLSRRLEQVEAVYNHQFRGIGR